MKVECCGSVRETSFCCDCGRCLEMLDRRIELYYADTVQGHVLSVQPTLSVNDGMLRLAFHGRAYFANGCEHSAGTVSDVLIMLHHDATVTVEVAKGERSATKPDMLDVGDKPPVLNVIVFPWERVGELIPAGSE